jgi:hypothetical protein
MPRRVKPSQHGEAWPIGTAAVALDSARFSDGSVGERVATAIAQFGGGQHLAGLPLDWREFTAWCGQHYLDPVPSAPGIGRRLCSPARGSDRQCSHHARFLSGNRGASWALGRLAAAAIRAAWGGVEVVAGGRDYSRLAKHE